MDIIRSMSNERIKEVRKLKDAKFRRERQAFLAEGESCLSEAFDWPLGRVRTVFVHEGHAKRYAHLLTRAREGGAYVCELTQPVFESICELKTPQGIVGVVERCGKPQPPAGFAVALENVQDPKNVGAIIRSADAAGADAVILSVGCADAFSPKAIRASMGSVFHLNVLPVPEFTEYLEGLKAQGYCLVGSHLKGQETRFCVKAPVCLLIGNEGKGLSEQVSALCDRLVRIPIYGRAESLNAAVAAGILLYRIAEDIK